MKHQNIDNNLLGYNALYKSQKNYSWFKKSSQLLNIDMSVIPSQVNTGENYYRYVRSS